jgi:hypothetical protein
VLQSVDILAQIYFPNFQVTPTVQENYAYIAERLRENWEAETYRENRVPVDPLVISLEETSKGENDSHVWPIPLLQTLRVLMVHRFGLIHVAIHRGHTLIVMYCILSVLC